MINHGKHKSNTSSILGLKLNKQIIHFCMQISLNTLVLGHKNEFTFTFSRIFKLRKQPKKFEAICWTHLL